MGAKKTSKPKTKADKPKGKGGRPVGKKTEDALHISVPGELTKFDLEFCDAYVRNRGKASLAYAEVSPEVKEPRHAGYRMMKRPEIRDHIKTILRLISEDRNRIAKASARSALLTLEAADDRLLEILQTRRRTRGEMLSRDVKELLVLGATQTYDDKGKPDGYDLSEELKTSLLEEGAPVEDADLLKAVKLVYDRRGGVTKPEKKADVTFVGAMLYKPAWYGQQRQPQTIDAEVA